MLITANKAKELSDETSKDNFSKTMKRINELIKASVIRGSYNTCLIVEDEEIFPCVIQELRENGYKVKRSWATKQFIDISWRNLK